jgi:thioredoxin-related protein
MINCGWCKIAIDQFNKPDFQFAENLVPLYINPVDSKEKMDKYQSKVGIPFPVLINAKKVGEVYGVNGYPTFFLIDENGKVEEVIEGFSEEEILKWKRPEIRTNPISTK